MIKKTGYFESDVLNPYVNLALEEWLYNRVGDDEVIMYLWRNERTVVVGRNQNIWNECNVVRLNEDNGYPARRHSGGGAVYHDAGNLNFTFIAAKENYSVERQLNVIIGAVRRLGLNAEKTGRNDICIDGRKFSGNAFYEGVKRCYHHGTILIRTDVAVMNRYLNVAPDKLKSKGVSSVRSRVVNLAELDESINVERMKEALKESFVEEYGVEPQLICPDENELGQIEEMKQKYSSESWLYNTSATFSCRVAGRYPWGGAEVLLDVHKGVIEECEIFTDSLEVAVFDRLKESLRGCVFMPDTLTEILSGVAHTETERTVTDDLMRLIKERLFD